ncbi:hypothetical protein ACNPKZ_22525 [Shewanella algae]|uniref:hypothetical protein n=1 Tax=Shewanella algae TaxID=38313 RepID=UPI003AAE4B76
MENNEYKLDPFKRVEINELLLEETILAARKEVYEEEMKRLRQVKAGRRNLLLNDVIDIPLASLEVDSENDAILVIRTRVFTENTPKNVLYALFGLTALSKHQLESEEHNSGLHVHLLNKDKKRYSVIFTAETKKAINSKGKKEVTHDVFYEPHSKGKSQLKSVNVSGYSKKKRTDIYNGVVKLLCGFDMDRRKRKSGKAEILYIN